MYGNCQIASGIKHYNCGLSALKPPDIPGGVARQQASLQMVVVHVLRPQRRHV